MSVIHPHIYPLYPVITLKMVGDMFHYPHCPMIIIKYNVYIYNIYILLVVYSISKYHQVSILTTVYLHSIPIPQNVW